MKSAVDWGTRHESWRIPLALLLLVAAYFVLINQTPYCYTERTFSDGSVEYREFPNSDQAFRYEQKHDFWSSGNATRAEESGCSSDKVYPLEAGIAGAFVIAALAVVARGNGKRGGRPRVLRFLLLIATILAFLAVFSFGSFIAPFLIPLHFLAARRSQGLERALWVLLAGLSGLLVGAMLEWLFFPGLPPFLVGGLVAAACSFVSVVRPDLGSGEAV